LVWQYPIFIFGKEIVKFSTFSPLKAGATLVALEALALVAYSISIVVDILAGQVKILAMLLSYIALLLAFALWMTLAAKGLWQSKRWARSSAITWQIMQLSVAAASFTGEFANYAVGIAIAVPSVLVLALLFSKSVIKAFSQID
jgi:hypothetical protein